MQITWHPKQSAYYTRLERTAPIDIGVTDDHGRPIALMAQIEQPPNSPNVFRARVKQLRALREHGNMGQRANYQTFDTIEAARVWVLERMPQISSQLARHHGANGT